MPAVELTPERCDEVVRSGELEVLGRMAWSSNATLLVNAALDGVEVRAIYKPVQGERPLWDFPDGTLAGREVAAYVLSDFLGWDIVPFTVMRDGPYGPGMVQRFVDHDPDDHYFTLLERHAETFRRFAVFDLLANNTDRKGGHCLEERGTGRVYGIDHGLTFRQHTEHLNNQAHKRNNIIKTLTSNTAGLQKEEIVQVYKALTRLTTAVQHGALTSVTPTGSASSHVKMMPYVWQRDVSK